ncbi:MAG: HAMP domain-containing sensor histidine kinase [Lachnospiraceae bacterium]|nr:HAMP domain-containing sensor histidine kinase [Lachnospiraceae bacterium]
MGRKMKTVIISVFVSIYVLAMTGATVFAVFYRKSEMEHDCSTKSVSLISVLSSADKLRNDMGVAESNEIIMEYQAYLTELLAMHSDRYHQMSAAFYDMQGNKLAESGSLLGNMQSNSVESVQEGSQMMYTYHFYYDVSRYLNREELKQIGRYLEQNEKKEESYSPELYRISIRVQKTELTDLAVQKITWTDVDQNPDAQEKMDSLTGIGWSYQIPVYREMEPGTENGYSYYIKEENVEKVVNYIQTDDEVVFRWTAGQGEEDMSQTEWQSGVSVLFPGMKNGSKEWLQWVNNEYLHQFPEKILNMQTALERLYSGEGENLEETSGIGFQVDRWNRILTCYPVAMEDADLDGNTDGFSNTENSTGITMAEPYYYLFVTAEMHPVLAAIHMLRFVYFGSGLFILACMLLVLYVIGRTSEKRAQLEESRRDFTNAVAHELKTPLGITRAFAENLMENTVEEKKEYYLEQIVRQTEEMDRLVLDMIDASRLDSDLLVLQKEVICINELLTEQLEKLKPAMEQKNLTVKIQTEGVFTVIGDPKYLEKAIWNLLDNTVVHNRENGSIFICMKEKELILENTMVAAGENVSGEQSTGIGLYLTEKILEKHHMLLLMEKDEKGGMCRFRLQ